MNTILFDGVEFTPLLDYEIVVKDYYISRCAKVLNYRTKKYINPYENYRGKKEHGDFKSMRINLQLMDNLIGIKVISIQQQVRIRIK